MNDDERELLSDLSTLRPHLRDGTDAYPTPGESFFSSGSVAVLGDGPYRLFRKCVAGVHQVMHSDAKLVGHKTIEASILEVLWALEGRALDRSTLAAVRERLQGDALEDWTVSRLLRGARLDGENVVHLGPFTIWKTPTHAPQLKWANEHASEAHMLRPCGFALHEDGVRLIADRRELATIDRRARELRARRLSLRAVAASLASEGRVSRSGRPFLAEQIARMLGPGVTACSGT